jgi:2,3-bisphosphoglycerate-independent phosphoglycerate mutase
MKFLLLILDGGADTGERTPYQTANKPVMDSLAKNGMCGLLDMGYKGTPQSEFGYLNILGFYSDVSYPGRGYLEALGLGTEDIKGNDICIRGNFASLAASGNLLDRRAGRNEKGLEELAERLDGTEIDGVHFEVRKSAGHRVVVIMKPLDGRIRLSDQVTSNDPERTNVPVLQIKPKTSEGKFTASVLNKFVSKSNRILSAERLNSERKPPANILLLRGFGRKKKVETFRERYGMNSCCVAGIPIVKGVASFLGMDIITVHGATGYPDTDLRAKFRETFEALQKYDFVLLHINGTDILSHDARRGEKAEFIGRIDRELGEILKKTDMKETVVIITSDHRTASGKDFQGYRHTKDPVPVLVSGNGIRPDRIGKFDEVSCAGGFFVKGNGLLPFVRKLIK